MDVRLPSILRVLGMDPFADRKVLRPTDAGGKELGVRVHRHRCVSASKRGGDRLVLLLVTLQVLLFTIV